METLISGETVTAANHDDWLEARRHSIGASEAATALWLNPYETPLELYLRKIGDLPDREENEAMRWGHILEAPILEAYEIETAKTVEMTQVFMRHETDPVHATIDAMVRDLDGEAHLVEVKTTSAYNSGAIGEGDELPDTWLIQAAIQMHVSGYDRADFAILIGGQKFVIRRVDRNQALIDTILPKLREFWACVESRTPPLVTDWSRVPTAVLGTLYPPTGETWPITPDEAHLLESYEQLGAQIKALEDQRNAAKAELIASLQGRTIQADDGRLISLVEVPAGKPYTVTPKPYHKLSIKKGRK